MGILGKNGNEIEPVRDKALRWFRGLKKIWRKSNNVKIYDIKIS